MIIEDLDFEDVWESLKFLKEHGHWSFQQPPEWAVRAAEMFKTSPGSPSVIMWGYEFVAEKAMESVEEFRSRDIPGSDN